MAFVTYLYSDPKTAEVRYVGKGLETRPYEHLTHSTRSHQQLRRMLQKRIIEGFDPQPIVIQALNEEEAFEMEELLISMIGRLDLGTGTLFNNTNGGEGESGRVVSEDTRAKCSNSYHSRTSAQKAETFKKLSAAVRKGHAAMSAEEKQCGINKMRTSKMRSCTLDGSVIYSSRLHMIEALGQSSKGSRSPNFRYI